MQSKIKNSKTFCLAPWISIHTWPDGKTFPCCLWNSDDPVGNINENTLEEIWNSDKMKDARLKMLNGEEIESCKRCYHLENIGDGSYRQRINNLHSSKVTEVDKTNVDGSLDDMKLYLWDVRLSNFCNFKCRSCGAELSSSWHSDTIKLGASLEQYPKAVINVNDRASFMSMLEPHYEYVDEIYFAGGEPLLMPEHYTILEKLIELGRTDVLIRYSTNFSKMNFGKKNIFDYWKHFSNIQLYISIDGVGKIGEYVRKGYNDLEFDNNIRLLKESGIKPTESGYVITYGVLNFLHLFDLVVEFIKRDYVDIGEPTGDRRSLIFNPIDTPPHYDSKYLPTSFKIAFKDRLDRFGNELTKLGCSNFFIKEVMGIMTNIYNRSISEEHNIEIMQKCIDITLQLDNIRNEDIKESIPYLKDLNSLIRTK